MAPLVVAGCETLLKIPARVIGKATSVHEGQPAHVTLELALSQGPSQITIVFPNANEASVFDETVSYVEDEKNPGTNKPVYHEPQRLYLLVCDADTVDAQDGLFQETLEAIKSGDEPPANMTDESIAAAGVVSGKAQDFLAGSGTGRYGASDPVGGAVVGQQQSPGGPPPQTEPTSPTPVPVPGTDPVEKPVSSVENAGSQTP